MEAVNAADLREPASAPDWLVEVLGRPKTRVAAGRVKASSASGATAYARRAFQEERHAVLSAVEGTRNETLNRAAFSLGQLVASDELDEAQVRDGLADAGIAAGLGEGEARATIASGLDAGKDSPRPARAERNRVAAASIGSAAVKPHSSQPVDTATIGASVEDEAHRTELGLADRIVARHGDDLLYCYSWKKWFRWDGQRWAIDRSGAVWVRAKEVVRGLYIEAECEPDAAERDRKTKFALRCEKESCIRAALVLAQSEVAVVPEDLNQDRWLLNTVSGTIDLRTGQKYAHRRADRITRLCPTVYDPNALCPTFEKFLLRIFDRDLELICYLQRLFGYSLTGSQLEHLLAVLVGRGANGKSTLIGAVSRVLGTDYAVQLAPNLLFQDKKDAHPTGVADLYGKRFAATHELDAGTRLAEGLVKQITGGDRIRTRRMREDFWEFDPTHTLFLCANTKPVIRGTDDGIWRRIRLIPFRVQIPRNEQDAALPDKLAAEAPGVLAWLVAGAKEWQWIGLKDPDTVLEATSDYRQDSDVVGQFLSDRCRLGEGLYVSAKLLYEAYGTWHKEALGGEPMTQGILGRRLSDRGLIRKKHGTYRWEGVELA